MCIAFHFSGYRFVNKVPIYVFVVLLYTAKVFISLNVEKIAPRNVVCVSCCKASHALVLCQNIPQ